jgi:hypothetical protein
VDNINERRGASDESSVTSLPEPLLLSAGAKTRSLDQERREVLASVLTALAGHAPDLDEIAACGHLLKHLAQAAMRLPPNQPGLLSATMDG